MGREEASTFPPKAGNKSTTNGNATQLAALSASSALQKGVQITSDSSNSGTVYVGDSQITASGATTDGYPLTAGQSVFIATDDLSKVYFRASGSGFKLHFIGT